jgi:hypothetical protein
VRWHVTRWWPAGSHGGTPSRALPRAARDAGAGARPSPPPRARRRRRRPTPPRAAAASIAPPPGRSASASSTSRSRSVSATTSPSSATRRPCRRTSAPARSRVRARLTNASARAMTMEPSRGRGGTTGSPRPARWAPSAQTGPTQVATTSPSAKAARSSSVRPASSASSQRFSTWGRAVKVTASIRRSHTAARSRSAGCQVVGQGPAVDGDGGDVGAEAPHGLDQRCPGGPVELHGDPPAVHAAALELRHHLRRAPAGVCQATSSPTVTAAPWALGPRASTTERPQGVEEVLGAVEALGGLDPAPHADAGGEQRHLRWRLDHRPDGRRQVRLDAQRVGPDEGAVHDVGPLAGEQLDLLAGAPVGGHRDAPAGQGPQSHGRHAGGLAFRGRFSPVTARRRTCTVPSSSSTAWVRRVRAGSVRQLPVRRS